jgi:hypothetical protein
MRTRPTRFRSETIAAGQQVQPDEDNDRQRHYRLRMAFVGPLWVQGVTEPSMGLGSHGRFCARLGIGMDLALAMPERGAYQAFVIRSPVMLSPAWISHIDLAQHRPATPLSQLG